MRRPGLTVGVRVAAAGVAVGLGLSLVAAQARSQGHLTVTSPAFPSGGFIPVDFSCDGRGNSPPLDWSAAPAGTRSIAVVVDDPDAAAGRFTHWVLYDLPPDTTHLAPDAVARASLPAGAVQGKNGKGQSGWAPVCPPPPGVHHYHFDVYALDESVPLASATEQDLASAMRGHVLAQGEIVGMFQRQGH